jgi:tetratricopeptide (TPR) repeat protein
MQWVKDADGRIRFKKNPVLLIFSAQCLMDPCEDEKDFKYILYNLGGGLATLITGVIFLVTAFLSANDNIADFARGMGDFSVLISLYYLIPYTNQLSPNEARNIKEISRSPLAKHGNYLRQRINADLAAGKHMSDYPAELFYLDENADTGNYMIADILFLGADRYEELGEYDKMREMLYKIDVTKLPAIYRCQFYMPMMFEDLVVNATEQSVMRARDFLNWCENSGKFGAYWKKTLTMKHPICMMYNAAKIAFIDGKPDEARRLIEEARKMLPSLQSPGTAYAFEVIVERLENKLDGKLKEKLTI